MTAYQGPRVRRRTPPLSVVVSRRISDFVTASVEMAQKNPIQFLQYAGMATVTAAAAVKMSPFAALVCAGATVGTILTRKPLPVNQRRPSPLRHTKTRGRQISDVACFTLLVAGGFAALTGLQAWREATHPAVQVAQAAIKEGYLMPRGEALMDKASNNVLLAEKISIKELSELPFFKRFTSGRGGVIGYDVPVKDFSSLVTGKPVGTIHASTAFDPEEVTVTHEKGKIRSLAFRTELKPRTIHLQANPDGSFL